MGTNYYMITKNKDLVRQYFDNEYELTDVPDFHYEIHLNKLSCGWKPLFQNHKAFRTFKELEKFCFEHKDDLSFKDEYGRSYSFEEYKKDMVEHSERTPEPVKWVYEESKFGMEVEDFPAMCELAKGMEHVRVLGLMCIAPNYDNVEDVRPVFRIAHALYEDMKPKFPEGQIRYLSMGMTHDFEIAIEEGANVVRVGTAIFGPRNY